MKNDIELIALAKNIKLVAFDVDGVMTNSTLTFLEDGREIKTYSAKDGLGVVMLSKAGIVTAIITARQNPVVKLRAEMIDIKELFEGAKNKIVALEELKNKYNLKNEEIAYMGDDLPDLCVLRQVGLKACPNDAIGDVRNVCNFVSSYEGGKGAVRELCDFILKSKGISYDDLANATKQ